MWRAMLTFLLVVQAIVAAALVGVILMQRSEGGGLGMGGNAGGFMTVRGSANLLTRTTGILAALFFATAIGLTLLNGADHSAQSILEKAVGTGTVNGKPAPATSVLDALNATQKSSDTTTPAPATTTPAQDAPNLALPATSGSSTSTTAPATGTTPAKPATN